MENNEVPVLEIQENRDAEDVEMESGDVLPEKKGTNAAPITEDKGKGKAVEQAEESVQASTSKKRKRDSESGMGKVKRGTKEEGDAPKKKKKGNDEKQRFILFVGNLKYSTSLDSIKDHFSACDPPPSVRLLTPKTPTNSKSKGCAFLEFTHRNALQQALKLHQSQLDGRAINVELTAGGGGKSSARLEKVKERNKKLHDQRKERLEKSGENSSRPQRYSATSGVGAAPDTKQTWTVDGADDGSVHRGGKKHAKKTRPQRSKEWGTGVNAIPVG